MCHKIIDFQSNQYFEWIVRLSRCSLSCPRRHFSKYLIFFFFRYKLWCFVEYFVSCLMALSHLWFGLFGPDQTDKTICRSILQVTRWLDIFGVSILHYRHIIRNHVGKCKSREWQQRGLHLKSHTDVLHVTMVTSLFTETETYTSLTQINYKIASWILVHEQQMNLLVLNLLNKC